LNDRETPGQMLHRLLLAKGVLRSRGRWLRRQPSTRAAYEEVAAVMQATPPAGGVNLEDLSRLDVRERIARLEAELERLKARIERE
jgi:uncharacterized small protein (DUF1192 family)